MSGNRVGIYPGTFDPIHLGHIEVIRRATLMVDRLIVAVAINAGKDPLFSLEERRSMVAHELDRLAAGNQMNGAKIEVVTFNSLLMQFADDLGAQLVIRGLRAVSDFEYEFLMALNNKRLKPKIETVFLMASETSQFISSRFVKEIHGLGGDVSSMVSPAVQGMLDAKRAGSRTARSEP